MFELLFLLLPIAALSGWWVGKKVSGISFYNNLPQEKILSRDQLDTLENHLALGNWFRRRGEVDKAINIHEYLTTSQSLSTQERAVSLLELSRDYMRAGVLDRAEQLLLTLVSQSTEVIPSLNHLLEIYQQSKDWLRAIDTARKLQQISGCNMRYQIANYYCELSENSWLNGNRQDADDYLHEATKVNKNCVRAYILLASMAMHSGKYKLALKTYKTVYNKDPLFLPEILSAMGTCYEQLDDLEGLNNFLVTALKENPSTSIVVAMSKYIAKQKDPSLAINFVMEQVQLRPNLLGAYHLLSLLNTSHSVTDEFKVLENMMATIIGDKAGYRCQRCGFTSRTMQWQCPSCRKFDAIKPMKD